jgi:site-specific DNA recombinase
MKYGIYTRTADKTIAGKKCCISQEKKIKSFLKRKKNVKHCCTYSDVGYSGANTNRPALKQMLRDVSQNKLNVIVTCSITKLTRSLRDFLKLIKYFEKHEVLVISVLDKMDSSKIPKWNLLKKALHDFCEFEKKYYMNNGNV